MFHNAQRGTGQPDNLRPDTQPIQADWGAAPRRKRRARLASALNVERRALETVLTEAQGSLEELRSLSLPKLLALPLRPGDAERIFYLVQWEGLQAHLETHGKLPEAAHLEPLLCALNPIFERHFSRSSYLGDALLVYRAELGERQETEICTRTPLSRAKRLLLWLGSGA